MTPTVRRPGAPHTLVLVGPLPPPSGGMANQTRQLARLLREEGLDVRLVQTNAPYRPGFIGAIRGVRALFRLVPYVVRLWRACNGADIVHVMANSGWAWHLLATPAIRIAALRGVPVVVNYRGGEAAAFLDRQFRWVGPTLARASLVIVPSGFLREIFGKHGVTAEIVPNVVDLDAFRPAPELPSAPHLIVTRNLERIYDIQTAIRAFATIAAARPDARMTIAGSGPERSALERLASELGLAGRIVFTGRLDNAELPSLYRSASVVVNPSLVDNMPNSLLEAMASGVPIVSTDVGGVPHLVQQGETALLVPPRQPDTMAAAVQRVLTEPGLARRLRTAGLTAVAAFAWTEVRPRILDSYRRASSRSPLAEVLS